MFLFDTRTSSLVQVLEKRVRIYVCGITPYDYSHLGHARSAVVFDTMRRYLEFKGKEVVFVQNYTDVDDKIVARAVREGKTQKEIAERFIAEYEEDMRKLNVKRPDYSPRVTENIPEIISFIERLLEKGFAYEVDGDVFFHVPSFPKYGELSKQSIDELNRHRIEPDPRKRDVKDFALWKKAKEEDIMAKACFDSPWGIGRPGWHIECSVLSSKFLGVPFEIHGGGRDLIFPHHENERAQSFAVFGVEPVKIWVHNDFLTISGEKMSKSLGNIVRIRDVVSRYGGEVLRYFLLTAHYRSSIDYSESGIERAKKAYDYIKNTLTNLDMEIAFLKTFGDRNGREIDLSNFKNRFLNAMDNDLNTAKAIAEIHSLSNHLNRELHYLSLRSLEESFKTLRTFLSILGLFEDWKRIRTLKEEEVEMLVERELARKEGDFEKADEIRKKFRERGLILIDTKWGVRWYE
uniref:Cysteine--tRNA ligase n=1 Tax=Archaeoglobus fulgidus TaxID=2234 RepID=A0A7J2TH22_ARCFL